MRLRNVAIIAHVDHGKTTLVDQLFRQSGTFRDNQRIEERAMDSNDLEKERGITILAKCTSVDWEGTRINIVDTPGHADFGGEVERILSMVDGVILLVDASEGAMPQTKFVTGKALALGLRPIVVVNKIDRPDERIQEVLDEVFDLFVTLEATDEQLDFPVLYASGRNGYANDDHNLREGTLAPLFNKIVEHVPAPSADPDGPFKFLVTLLDRDNFVGRILTGLVFSGSVKTNMPIHALDNDGKIVETGRASKIMTFRGLERVPTDEANAGDIISLAGLTVATVSNTICDPSVTEPLHAQAIDPPTLSMRFSVNDSPMAGREGSKVTSRMIRDRLFRESESNVAIKVTEAADKDSFEVAGRGELQLGVLIETMRREGFELGISRPRVLFGEDENGKRTEPYETVIIDVDEEYSGTVVEKMNLRKAEMTDMRPSGGGKTRITFSAPSRGMIGYHGEFLSDTRGTGIMNRLFEKYGPHKGTIEGRKNGVLISNGAGEANSYALGPLEERGILFVGHGEALYEGMVVGENAKPDDLEVNPMKTKQLTNFRASGGKDDAIRLTPPKRMTLEQAIAYIDDDEMVEVTPKSIRLRKRYLDPNERKAGEPGEASRLTRRRQRQLRRSLKSGGRPRSGEDRRRSFTAALFPVRAGDQVAKPPAWLKPLGAVSPDHCRSLVLLRRPKKNNPSTSSRRTGGRRQPYHHLDTHRVSRYVPRMTMPQPLRPVNLRVRDDIRAIIDQAAQAQGRSRSDFMIDAARRAAEDVLIDRTVFRVDQPTYDAFIAALDAPPADNPKLAKAMRARAPWHQGE